MQPQTSFYVLQPQAHKEFVNTMLFSVVARLCAKATAVGKVAILCDEPMLNELSDYLWSYKDDMFLAHAINENTNHLNITNKPSISDGVHTVINVSTMLPTTDTSINSTTHIARILEFIVPTDESKIAGRTRYSHYKNAYNTVPQTHKVAV